VFAEASKTKSIVNSAVVNDAVRARLEADREGEG
jgi:hypothetical protein